MANISCVRRNFPGFDLHETQNKRKHDQVKIIQKPQNKNISKRKKRKKIHIGLRFLRMSSPHFKISKKTGNKSETNRPEEGIRKKRVVLIGKRTQRTDVHLRFSQKNVCNRLENKLMTSRLLCANTCPLCCHCHRHRHHHRPLFVHLWRNGALLVEEQQVFNRKV